jgi:hypothetical protein
MTSMRSVIVRMTPSLGTSLRPITSMPVRRSPHRARGGFQGQIPVDASVLKWVLCSFCRGAVN